MPVEIFGENDSPRPFSDVGPEGLVMVCGDKGEGRSAFVGKDKKDNTSVETKQIESILILETLCIYLLLAIYRPKSPVTPDTFSECFCHGNRLFLQLIAHTDTHDSDIIVAGVFSAIFDITIGAEI